MPKLQLALDNISLEDAFRLVEQLESKIDIVEVGTPLVLKYGLKAVSELKHKFHSLEILCDAKIMDAGGYESGITFAAGADWVTVMAFTDTATIEQCVEASKKARGKVMADMLCVTDFPGRVSVLEELGIDCIAVHTGVDQQRLGQTALDDLRELKRYVKKSKIAVAAGITDDTLDEYLKLAPDIIIVGNGIIGQPNPIVAATAIHNKIVSFSTNV